MREGVGRLRLRIEKILISLSHSLRSVIQSEAKNLENIHVDILVYATEILHYTSFRSEWQNEQ